MPNPRGGLKPGLFATARIQQPAPTPGLLVPASSSDGRGHEPRLRRQRRPRRDRVVNVGQTVRDLVEITNGLKGGEQLATANLSQLADGTLDA